MKYRFISPILSKKGLRELHDIYLAPYNPSYAALSSSRLLVLLDINNDEDLAFLTLVLPVKLDIFQPVWKTPVLKPIDHFLEQL